jgi:hypothetical protein
MSGGRYAQFLAQSNALATVNTPTWFFVFADDALLA